MEKRRTVEETEIEVGKTWQEINTTRRRKSMLENQIKTKSILRRLSGYQLVVAQNEQLQKRQEIINYEDEISDELNTTQISESKFTGLFEETVKIWLNNHKDQKSLSLPTRHKEHEQQYGDPCHHGGNRKFHNGPANRKDVEAIVEDNAVETKSQTLPANLRKQPSRTSPWFKPNSKEQFDCNQRNESDYKITHFFVAVIKRALTRSVVSHVSSFTKKDGLESTEDEKNTKPESILRRLSDHQLVVAQNEQLSELQETYKYEDESSDELNTTQMSVSELIGLFEGTVKIRRSKYEGRKSLNVSIRRKEHMQPNDDPDHHDRNRKFYDESIVRNEDVQLRHKQDYNENHKTDNLPIHRGEDVQRSIAVKDDAAVIESHKLPANPRKQPPRTSPWFNPNCKEQLNKELEVIGR
uniref:Uncharacterized protein n=1 Tax=Angiostrongylus cantonensis TaxID=6313 RepID=A0A0K0DQ10_ANGCA